MEDWLKARARSSPTTTALIIEDAKWSFADLDSLADQWARQLSTAGVTPDQMVGVLLPNGLDYVCLIFALIRLHATLVPLNIRLTPSELAWQLNHTQCRYLIYNTETATQAHNLENTSCVALSVESIQNLEPSDLPFDDEINPSATQSIIFTSGTSGTPKGVMLSLNNHMASATASAFRLGILPTDQWLCCLPLYHVGGLNIILRCCLYGIPVNLQHGFKIEAMQHALENHPVTLVSLVPTMLHRLLQIETLHLDRLRLILLGGAAASPQLLTICQERNIPIATTYGLSEACSQVATLLPPISYQKAGSVGKPLIFTSVQILDENCQPLPIGTIGDIAVRGLTLMQGYFNNPEATAHTMSNGNLLTGDMGYLDEDGDLWVVQRRSDLILSGGENIYPAEIEGVLASHPAIAQSCVVGVPHPEWGQQVAAAIVLHPDQDLPLDALQAFCRQHLAGYKIPRIVHIVESLPHTSSGKIQRRTVQQMIEQQL